MYQSGTRSRTMEIHDNRPVDYRWHTMMMSSLVLISDCKVIVSLSDGQVLVIEWKTVVSGPSRQLRDVRGWSADCLMPYMGYDLQQTWVCRIYKCISNAMGLEYHNGQVLTPSDSRWRNIRAFKIMPRLFPSGVLSLTRWQPTHLIHKTSDTSSSFSAQPYCFKLISCTLKPHY